MSGRVDSVRCSSREAIGSSDGLEGLLRLRSEASLGSAIEGAVVVTAWELSFRSAVVAAELGRSASTAGEPPAQRRYCV